MIDDVDMQDKTDGELLGMWAGQNEIVDGLVDRVRAEIKRRGARHLSFAKTSYARNGLILSSDDDTVIGSC